MRLVAYLFLGSVGLVGACASDPGMTGDDYGPVNCAETNADQFVVGLERAGDAGALDFTLLQADPAPPARNDNTWIIQVNAMTSGAVGDPVAGASIVVTPFMPAHQHGAGKTVKIEAMPDAGQYKLAPINLWMPGVWETTIQVDSAAGSDQVVFRFCIPS